MRGRAGAVLTLMLSCQRWAFWKVSAASASLCGQSTGRSEAKEALPAQRETPEGQVPPSRASAHRPPLPSQPPTLPRLWLPEPLPARLTTPSAQRRLALRVGLVPAAASLEASACEHGRMSAHPPLVTQHARHHTLLTCGDMAAPALPSHGPEGRTDTPPGRTTRAGIAEVLSTVGTWDIREGFPGEVLRP